VRKCHAPNALNNLATGLVRLSILGLLQSSGDPKSREAFMSSVIVEKNVPSGGLVLRVRLPSGLCRGRGSTNTTAYRNRLVVEDISPPNSCPQERPPSWAVVLSVSAPRRSRQAFHAFSHPTAGHHIALGYITSPWANCRSLNGCHRTACVRSHLCSRAPLHLEASQS